MVGMRKAVENQVSCKTFLRILILLVLGIWFLLVILILVLFAGHTGRFLLLILVPDVEGGVSSFAPKSRHTC